MIFVGLSFLDVAGKGTASKYATLQNLSVRLTLTAKPQGFSAFFLIRKSRRKLCDLRGESGDISKSKVSGVSAVSRKALWQWVFSSVEPAHRRHRTPSLLVRRKIESKDEYELIHLGVWIDKEKNLV